MRRAPTGVERLTLTCHPCLARRLSSCSQARFGEPVSATFSEPCRKGFNSEHKLVSHPISACECGTYVAMWCSRYSCLTCDQRWVCSYCKTCGSCRLKSFQCQSVGGFPSAARHCFHCVGMIRALIDFVLLRLSILVSAVSGSWLFEDACIVLLEDMASSAWRK